MNQEKLTKFDFVKVFLVIVTGIFFVNGIIDLLIFKRFIGLAEMMAAPIVLFMSTLVVVVFEDKTKEKAK